MGNSINCDQRSNLSRPELPGANQGCRPAESEPDVDESRRLQNIGQRVLAGSRKGGQLSKQRSKRDEIIEEFLSLRTANPQLKVTAIRRRIVRQGIASLRTVVKHTKHLTK